MTEKRFVYYEHKGADYILDTPNKSLDFIEMLSDCLEAEEIADLLNQFNDENEQLKQSYTELKHKHSLLHDVCIEAECDRDSYQKDILSLEEENEKLKQLLLQNNDKSYSIKRAKKPYATTKELRE